MRLTTNDTVGEDCICAGEGEGDMNGSCGDALPAMADVVYTDSIIAGTNGAANICFTGGTSASWYSYTAAEGGETTVSSSIDLDTPDTST